ncbi:MAG TPA: prepilin-type N-terminal cleavage/methylation domain-containing protein [bacterium]|nr:prepilin-type N-terminal cleavage/methylation domain-containing protein [bacterium]
MSWFAMVKRARAQDGFSLLELVVALALAAIIVTGAMFNVRGAMNREALDGWVRSMTLEIAGAQQSAVTQRAPVNVTVTSTPGASSYALAVCPSACSTYRNAKAPKDITITTNCTSNICTFDKRGVPTSAATITLTSVSTGASNVITIQSNTGSVTYQ